MEGDVNNTPSEIPSRQQERTVNRSEAGIQNTHPDVIGRSGIRTLDLSLQPLAHRSETINLEFQDSQLSPALALHPCTDKSYALSDSSFFHHTDAEFVPLRGFPDLSVNSEQYQRMSHTGDVSCLRDVIVEESALSQHPLEMLSNQPESETSCFSLSQHTLSPGEQSKELHKYKLDRIMEGEEQLTVATQSSVDLKERDAFITNPSSTSEIPKEPLATLVSSQSNIMKSRIRLQAFTNFRGRGGPQGFTASSSIQKTSGLTVGANVQNVTFRDTRMHPSDCIHDEPLSLQFRGSRSARHGYHSDRCATPVSYDVRSDPALQKVLLNSGNFTGTDSFLSCHPVSQSTPAVAVRKPSPTIKSLSINQTRTSAFASGSSPNSERGRNTELSANLDTVQMISQAPFATLQRPDLVSTPLSSITPKSNCQLLHSAPEVKGQESHLAFDRVQFLPSLSYEQKVDAWKANQSSSRLFHDNLSLQPFDIVSEKKIAQDEVRGAPNHLLTCDVRQASEANAKSQIEKSNSERGSTHQLTQVGLSGLRQTSPIHNSQSHSSLSSVVTSIQMNTATQSQQDPVANSDAIVPAIQSLSNQSCLVSGQRVEGVNYSNPSMDKSSAKMPPLTLSQFSDVSSSLKLSSALSSSQNSSHCEQSLKASVGVASSVVSLEVDNYAPYWSSRPASPHNKELNIEDRIPLYLQNLGIEQSPSTILNPFTRRGPVRDPEFSPTDLCTIKSSMGTPTKSTQHSDVDSLRKEDFSGSSHLSGDSVNSVTPLTSVPSQGLPVGQESLNILNQEVSTLAFRPSSATISPQSIECGAEVKDKGSFRSSGTLNENRCRFPGQAEHVLSDRASLTSFSDSQRLLQSETSLVLLGQKAQGYKDMSGNLSLLTRSSSDSALKGNLSSTRGPHQIDQFNTESASLSLSREETLKSRDLCVTPRRAEPEGCSAVDPDKVKPQTAPSAMQINLLSLSKDLPLNQKREDSAVASSANDAEVENLSDSGSEDSLAAKVSRLLQSKSTVSMVTSRSSTASEPEDSRAREWILMKVSGRQCERLELNAEDSERIKELRREVQKNHKYTKWSSDSECSAQSSVGTEPPLKTDQSVMKNRENLLPSQLQEESTSSFHTSQQDLEAKVHQIDPTKGLLPPAYLKVGTTQLTPTSQSQSRCSVADIEEPVNFGLQNDGSATSFTKQMLQSDSEKETEVEKVNERRQRIENEATADDYKDNMVAEDSQIVQRTTRTHLVPDSNEIQSSIVPGLPSDIRSHISHQTVTLASKPELDSVKCDSSRATVAGSSLQISASLPTSSHKHKEQVPGQNPKTSRFQTRHHQNLAPLLGETTFRNVFTQPTDGPVLLPYKPRGCPEFFYVPKQKPQFSPSHSEASVESSHPGSDDAVPPRFGLEILGSRELEDCFKTPKHKDGIYSKRINVKRVSASMPEGDVEESTASGVNVQYDHAAPRLSGASQKDIGFFGNDEPYEHEEEHFAPLQMEADYSTNTIYPYSSVLEPESHTSPLKSKRMSYWSTEAKNRRPQDLSMASNSSLDPLWHRFNEKRRMEEIHTTHRGETSIIDRLKLLQQLIQSTITDQSPDNKRWDGDDGDRKQAWPEKEENHKSLNLCPAERDESSSVSTEISSVPCTIDKQRLLQTIKPHRMNSTGLKSSEDVLRLSSNKNKQKAGQRKPSFRHAAVSTDNVSTDDSSLYPDSSSSSIFAFTSPCAKGSKVKFVDKGVQAGDLEIVINGTRRNTRDVGTIFPTPEVFRNAVPNMANRSGHGIVPVLRDSTAKPQLAMKKDINSRNRSLYLNGMAWFVSADELKCNPRKENQLITEQSDQNQAWLGSYTGTRPITQTFREPLRERQVQVEQDKPSESRTSAETHPSDKALALSLQESLELHRPEFVSHSRDRIKRLGLLVEERRLQTAFSKEREKDHGPSKPFIEAPLPRRRAVPLREMVQRSRVKYAQLPEIQKKKLEENRQAEYRSYRLNAKLFNKKVTNRVLGKKTPWQ